MSRWRFDAVVFDAGGVLVVPNPQRVRGALASVGVHADINVVLRAHYRGMRAQDVDAADHDDWEVYHFAVARHCGASDEQLPAALDALAKLWDHRLWDHPRPDTLAVMRELNRRGVPLAVVSNAGGDIERVLIDAAVCQVGPGVGAEVRCVIDSTIVGVWKPDPAIFSFALEVLGTDPARTAYVGDSVRNDVVGARAAGLHPLHLDPHGDHPDARHERIASPADLLEWFE